jgi:hypothetical protein
MREIFACLVLLAAFSCARETIEEKSKGSDFIIKTGTVCGWCTVNDTLTIIGTTVRYVNYANCSTASPTVQKNGQLNLAERNDLLAKLNLSEFKKLELNSCNVCADGCDDWISFSNGTDSHTIRFSRNDPQLQPIKSFVDQLNQIKTQYTASK